jgi:serine/threonine protein kinase
VVHVATHIQSQAHFAVKSILKEKMTPIEVTQQRREIEVLKMCQHTNIIKLIDLFENSLQYFVVMEFMKGKDLFDYLESRNFSLSEI